MGLSVMASNGCGGLGTRDIFGICLRVQGTSLITNKNWKN